MCSSPINVKYWFAGLLHEVTEDVETPLVNSVEQLIDFVTE